MWRKILIGSLLGIFSVIFVLYSILMGVGAMTIIDPTVSRYGVWVDLVVMVGVVWLFASVYKAFRPKKKEPFYDPRCVVENWPPDYYNEQWIGRRR